MSLEVKINMESYDKATLELDYAYSMAQAMRSEEFRNYNSQIQDNLAAGLAAKIEYIQSLLTPKN